MTGPEESPHRERLVLMQVMDEERIGELLGKLERPPVEWEDAVRDIPRALHEGDRSRESAAVRDESHSSAD